MQVTGRPRRSTPSTAEMCLCVCVGLRAVTTFHVEREGDEGEEVEPVCELFGQKKSGSTSLMEAGGME